MASCRGKSGTGEGTSAGKCGQIGATLTKSGLPSVFLGRCKGLILRHNSGTRRFTAYLLQRCICPIGHFSQKHMETEEIQGPTMAKVLREPDIVDGQALNLTHLLNLTQARNTKLSMWRDVLS
jgi:hypothetical protein